MVEAASPLLRCPECGSERLYRDGLRYLSSGETVQRWLCRNCGYRFTERHNNSNINTCRNGNRQVCAILEEAKNLSNAQETRTCAGEKETQQQQVKGKIVELCFKMRRDGYSEETIRLTYSALKVLIVRGADLYNPDSVKDVIARQKWSEVRKRNVINAYTKFLKFLGLSWEPPKCRETRKIPFIPTEQEIDDLIAGSPVVVAAFLQLLKETAMRCGEALRLKWRDVDFERRIITLNEPEKGSLPRIFSNLSGKLLSMLNNLPRKNEFVFGDTTRDSIKNLYLRAKKRLAFKLGNPRLNEINFNTL
ncbi:MAG: tyrosine-type recombinase/integrase, partial [Candidatus Bathyarchaeia archaeon]